MNSKVFMRLLVLATVLSFSAVAAVFGCGSGTASDAGIADDSAIPEDTGGPVDDTGFVDTGSVPDAGTLDTGAVGDSGAEDAGVEDAGEAPDGGVADAGVVTDSGTPDTGVTDTGVATDSGAPDTGMDDTGVNTDGGVADTGGADTGVTDGGQADAGDGGVKTPCNDVVNDATAVSITSSTNAMPTGTGGAFVNGTYHMTAIVTHPGSPLVPGSITFKQTIRLTGTLVELAADDSDKPPFTGNMTIAPSGTAFTSTTTCTTEADPFEVPYDSFTATASSFTVYCSSIYFEATYTKK